MPYCPSNLLYVIFSESYNEGALIIWHEIERIGCGIASFDNDSHRNLLLVCNFGANKTESKGVLKDGMYDYKC